MSEPPKDHDRIRIDPPEAGYQAPQVSHVVVDQAENGANAGSVVAQASVAASAGVVAPPTDNSGASMITQGSSAFSGNTVRADGWIYDTGFGDFFPPAGVDDGVTFWTCNKCGKRRRQQRSKFYVDATGSRLGKLKKCIKCIRREFTQGRHKTTKPWDKSGGLGKGAGGAGGSGISV